MKFSIIICTKDRPHDLTNLFKSVAAQTVKPYEVIVVDGSDSPVEEVVRSFETQLNIKYTTLRPPGLTKQRNYGIGQVDPAPSWIGFLDDDLVLDPDCFEQLERFNHASSHYVGIGLSIYEQSKPTRSLLREFMLLDRYPGGVLTLAGWPAQIRAYEEHTPVEWINGGATFWRKDILQQFKFDEWFSGVGYYEDVDFSYRVSRFHPLAICATARCHHYHHEVPTEKMYRLGEWLIVAWWYFARIKNKFSVIAVIWGLFWMTFVNLVIGILKRDPRRWAAFKGNLNGLGKILNRQVLDAKGFQK